MERHANYVLDMELAHDMDVLTDTHKKNTLATYTLPTAMSDPITLNCMLLTGAQCLERSDKDPKTQNYAQYYSGHYRGRLLQTIHQALDDEQKAISDSTIAGLVKLETDEVCYEALSKRNTELICAQYLAGDRDYYHLHANALREIVNLSGGLHTLGMDGYLADLVIRYASPSRKNLFVKLTRVLESTRRRHHFSVLSHISHKLRN